MLRIRHGHALESKHANGTRVCSRIRSTLSHTWSLQLAVSHSQRLMGTERQGWGRVINARKASNDPTLGVGGEGKQDTHVISKLPFVQAMCNGSQPS